MNRLGAIVDDDDGGGGGGSAKLGSGANEAVWPYLHGNMNDSPPWSQISLNAKPNGNPSPRGQLLTILVRNISSKNRGVSTSTGLAVDYEYTTPEYNTFVFEGIIPPRASISHPLARLGALERFRYEKG